MFTVLLFLVLFVSLLLQFLNYLLLPPAQSPEDSPNIQISASPSNPKSEHEEVPEDSPNIQIPASPSNPKSEHEEVPADSPNIQIPASPSNPKSEHDEVAADSPNIQIPPSPSTPKLEHEEVPADSTNTQTVLSSLSAPMEHEKVPPAASSSSGSTLEHDVESHDVFLSFRGEDTRYAFTDHLYHAMRQQGIDAFRDTEKLKRGHSISPDLFKAIKESRIAVIILSANYASSTWCLDELAQIVECEGLTVLPVFYHVEPSEVRKQTGNFDKAFCKHEENFRDKDPGKLKKWREALYKVANLSGWTLNEGKERESEVIQRITTEILNRLSNVWSSDNNDLIGMDARIEKLMSYLDLGSNDVRSIGIAGMGGIGKSTLAQAVFEKIRLQFQSSCFINIADVRGKSLVKLQKLLCQNLKLENHEIIQNDSMGINLLRRRLSHKKVLIVLDDVDDSSQLEALVPKKIKEEQPCLGPGSRVIITTRDTHKLKEFGLLEDAIYEAEKLTDKEALQLLCQKAFKENHVPDKYRGLSNSFVKYCSGLPLALVVLGSHLCKRTVDEWSAALARLDKDPQKGIISVLQLSYDGLEETEKQIFLDIACFFRGESQYRVKPILKSCDFEPDIGIPVLIEKHLIKIEEDKLWMHDLLKQMGWHIVRQQSPEPGKRSRLWLDENSHEYEHSRRPWFDEDAREVVTENLGTIAVEGIYLSVLVKEEIRLKADPFLNMRKLRLLKICNVNLLGVRFEYLSNKLRLLEWHECPLDSLPSSFQPDKLVALKLPNSRIETLWNQRLCLEMLRLMDLSNCQYLVKTPDFSNFPNLEELTFEGCSQLSDVHPTLWRLKNLKVAVLKDCTSLERLPKPISLISLMVLILSGCSKLDEFPELVGNGETLLVLSLDGTAIRELPTTIRCLNGLIKLSLCACKNLVCLPSFICSLKSLRHLRLSYSSRIDQLPEDIGSLENLEELDACNTAIRKVPSSIVHLKNLKSLCFQGCRQVPGKCSDESLGLQLPKSFSGLSSLETLYLGQCDLAEGAIPDDIGCLSSLKHIRLDENNFVSIPESISQLPKLREIHIPDCSKLQSLPNCLPEDVNVEASGCPLLTNYPNQLKVWLSDEGIRHINCGNPNYASCPVPIPEEQTEEYLPKYIEDGIVLQQKLQLRFFHTEIPDWCSHKNDGSSVAMQVSDHEINKSSGVALFVVFEIFESGDNFDKSWESQQSRCTFKDDQGLEYIKIFGDFDKFRAGTHILVCYEPLKYFRVAKMLRKPGRFEASVSTDRPDLEVKSCGLELIFQEEARKFAQNLIEDCNPQMDFKFFRHCKELINAKGKESSSNIMAPNEVEKVSWKFDFNMHPGEDLQLLLSKVYEDFNRDIIYNATYPHCAKLLEWFGDHHLSRGPSVKIPLPPSLSSDGNWIGLALCARFSDLENQNTSIDKVNPEIAELVCHLETQNSGFEHLHHYRPTNEEFKRLCPTELVWLSYIPRQGFLDQLNECDLLEASFASESRGLSAEECGLRVVYQHDEQEFKDLCIFMNSFLDKRSERLEEYEAPKKGKHVLESDFNMHPREDLRLLLSVLYEGPYGREKDFGLFFPHKVVPFWFFHHYAGDVALCDFPVDLYDDQRWVGLELFVMVSSVYSINVESVLGVDLCSDEISTVSTSVMINTCLGSDQLVVIHIPRVRFPEQLNQCHGISALFRTATPDMRVRMCGSRLLYEQDLEDLILAITAYTSDSQDVIDSLCQHIQQLLGSYLPEEPSDPIVAVETVEQHSVEGENEVGRRNDHSSTERGDLIQERREKVFTSILHNYRSYLQQKHGCIESKRIISHSEGYLLDNGDPKPVFATHHLHVMVETRLYGSFSSEDWKRSLESLLQYFKVATLSVKGQMIAVLNPFTPSSVNNFCFPRKELPGWFTQQTRMPRIGLTILPHVCDDENWMGLAICATFSVHEHPSAVRDNLATRTSNVMCHLAASDGRCLSPAPVFTITKEKFKWLHLRGFMWLTYIPRSYLTEFRKVRDAEARMYNDCPGLMMTRWSVRPLFKQDVKEFNKAIVHCWTSFFNDDNLDLIRQSVEADENEQAHYFDRGETSKILMPKGHVKDFNRDFIYNGTYPHCAKLLEWFGDHTRGPSVKIPLPPSQSSDGNWIGLALYARFSDLENQTTSIDKVNPIIPELDCHLETENGTFKHLHHYRPTNEEFKRLCPTEFIWLSYIPRQGYLDQLNNECDLVEASFASESRGGFAEECGLRLVYQHDEQEFKDLCIFMNLLLDKKSERLEEHEAPKKGKQVLEYPEPELEWGSNAMWNLEIYDPERRHC